MVKLSEKDVVWIDTETTGLDPAKAEIIELAIVDSQRNILFNSRIKPSRIEDAEPKALEVNGYTPEDWGGTKPFSEHAEEILALLKWKIIGGHNPSFDLSMLKAEFRRLSPPMSIREFPYHCIDTCSLAMALLIQRKLPIWRRLLGVGDRRPSLLNLDALRRYYRIPVHEHHSALVDTLDAMTVYDHLMGLTTWHGSLMWNLSETAEWIRGQASLWGLAYLPAPTQESA